MVGTLREAQQVLGDLQTALDSRVMAVSPLNDLTEISNHMLPTDWQIVLFSFMGLFCGGHIHFKSKYIIFTFLVRPSPPFEKLTNLAALCSLHLSLR